MDEEGKGKGKGKAERINAQFSSMPCTECIGAGRLEGWFATPAYIAEGRGWGHIQSYCFEGDLFFHLQRSPWLRGINFQKKDEVTFEVIEVNGRCEAVKLLLPTQVQEMEEKRQSGEATDPNAPAPRDLCGQRVQGYTKSHYMLVAKQNWGFCSSDAFSGQVFWHTTENPEMADMEFDRDDIVEFDVCLDEQRGSQVRAKNMRFIAKADKPVIKPPYLSDSKRKKKEQWLKNWSTTPPPDWVCKYCGWQNFGRNKTCNFNDKNNQNCPGVRPPREEWPDVQDRKASDVSHEDEQAQKALTQKWAAHQQFGKEEEVPVGWHSEGLAQEFGAGAAGGDQGAALAAYDHQGSDEYAALAAHDQQGSWSSNSWDQPKQKQSGHIPVPVLGEDPNLLAAGLPGAIAAQQLKDKKALEEQQGLFADPAAAAIEWEAPPPQQSWGQVVPPPQVVAPPSACGGGAGGAAASAAAFGSAPDSNVRAMLALCLSAFNDFATSGEPVETATGKVATLAAEVNSVLGDDRSAKHAFAMQLAKNQWIIENGFEVRYQPGKNLVVVTRSPNAAGAAASGCGGAGAGAPMVVQPPNWGPPAEAQQWGPPAEAQQWGPPQAQQWGAPEAGLKRKAEWGW